MSGFIYIWYDRKHKRYYVGSHWGSENDGYICSSTWMRNSYRRRPQDFRRRIVSRIITTRADLLDEEYRWLSMIKPHELKTRYYNLRTHVGHWHGKGEEKFKNVREKISAAAKAMWERPGHREKMSETMKSIYEDPDHRAKLSTAIKKSYEDMSLRERVREKTREAMQDPEIRERILARPEFSKEHRQKIREAKEGKSWGRHSEESRRKIGDSNRGKPKKSVLCSEEKKQKLRRAIAGRKGTSNKPKKIEINGTTYSSVSEASRILGMSRATIRNLSS